MNDTVVLFMNANSLNIHNDLNDDNINNFNECLTLIYYVFWKIKCPLVFSRNIFFFYFNIIYNIVFVQ